LHSVSGVHNN